MCGIDRVPAVDPARMGEIDRVMIDRFGVSVLQLMELAGHAVAAAARRMLPGGSAVGRRVLVLAGRGGNGGDGLVAARLLHGWGAEVAVLLSHPDGRLAEPAARNLASLRAIGVPAAVPADPDAPLPPADLLIDALLGFGLAGPPGGVPAALIRAANAHSAPTLAVDLPSGLDGLSGTPFEPCIRAALTLTLALPKTGLLAPAARGVVGALEVADIGVPPEAYAAVGLAVPPLFAEGDVVRVS